MAGTKRFLGYISDHETKVDLLRNEAIASTIVRLINEHSNRPVTVGVHGDWGAGKSTILEMIEAGLAGKEGVLCLKFNGWQFQGFEDAKIALIEGVVTELIEQRGLLTKANDVQAVGKKEHRRSRCSTNSCRTVRSRSTRCTHSRESHYSRVGSRHQRKSEASEALHQCDEPPPSRTACIDPGKPWQNGSNESFNGKFRDECLSMQWFKNRIDAKMLIEEFRRHYNEVRPHSSLGELTPAEFKKTLATTTPTVAIS